MGVRMTAVFIPFPRVGRDVHHLSRIISVQAMSVNKNSIDNLDNIWTFYYTCRMSKNGKDLKPRHPIGVVSRRTGISQDLLRAWERRYGAVVPGRSDTGRRLYTDIDLQRLTLLKQLIEGGRRISDLAGLSPGDLSELAREDGVSALPHGDHDVGATPHNRFVDDALRAAERLDGPALERVLADATMSLSQGEVRRQVIVPLLREIGEKWRQGSVRIAHEHLATTIVRSYLDVVRTNGSSPPGPRVVVTTPLGQHHELGALMAAVAAEEIGWQAVYVGASIPPDEIAAAVNQLDARVLALSVVYCDDEATMIGQLRRVRRLLGEDVRIIVGGRAAHPIAGALRDIGVMVVEDITDLQRELEAARLQGPGS